MDDPALAARLSLPADDPDADLALAHAADSGRLELRVLRPPPSLARATPLRLAEAWSALDTTTGPGRSLKQPFLRAVGLRKGNPARPAVLDATAGLGEDAYLLHAFGCRVAAAERHPVVHALLADAIAHTGIDLTLHHADALSLLTKPRPAVAHSATTRPKPATTDRGFVADVIYLDPMFPTDRKTTPRKALRLLAWLLIDAPPTDEAALLTAARAAAARRVVVKRPRHAPDYAGVSPQHRHKGAAVRYDVYPAIG